MDSFESFLKKKASLASALYEERINIRIFDYMLDDFNRWIATEVLKLSELMKKQSGENVVPLYPQAFEVQICNQFECVDQFLKKIDELYSLKADKFGHKQFDDFYYTNSDEVIQELSKHEEIALVPLKLKEILTSTIDCHKGIFWDVNLGLSLKDIYEIGEHSLLGKRSKL